MIQALVLFGFAALTSAVYVIQDDYTTESFADRFDFFTDDDPTHGYVNYVDQDTAQRAGLYSVDNDQIYMGVDHTNIASGRGRDSVRISSKSTYNHGLFILDLAHMPGGQCGTWPAFWLLGPNWPDGGEVDIIEGVNSKKINGMALHTTSGCTISNRGQFSGELLYANCDINAPSQPYNSGCAIDAARSDSYGTGFNAIGGGVYATEWTSEHIAIWFFPRSAIPSDITSGNPNPENWGIPTSEFSGNCDIDSKFRDQQIIFDITFCGDWAGYDWNFDTACNARASSCNNFVQNNPKEYTDAYWQINSLKVFQDNGLSALSTRISATTIFSTTTSSTAMTTTTSISSRSTTTPASSTVVSEPTEATSTIQVPTSTFSTLLTTTSSSLPSQTKTESADRLVTSSRASDRTLPTTNEVISTLSTPLANTSVTRIGSFPNSSIYIRTTKLPMNPIITFPPIGQASSTLTTLAESAIAANSSLQSDPEPRSNSSSPTSTLPTITLLPTSVMLSATSLDAQIMSLNTTRSFRWMNSTTSASVSSTIAESTSCDAISGSFSSETVTSPSSTSSSAQQKVQPTVSNVVITVTETVLACSSLTGAPASAMITADAASQTITTGLDGGDGNGSGLRDGQNGGWTRGGKWKK